MVNQSQINDPRCWDKWRKSGAIGTAKTARDKDQTKEYLHTPLFRWSPIGIGIGASFTFQERIRTIGERKVQYKGSEVLAVSCESARGSDIKPYTIVPGYVVGWQTGDNGFGLRTSQVTPVDRNDQPDLERNLVSLGFKGPVTCWSAESRITKNYTRG